MTARSPHDIRAFILEHTELVAPPLLPEVKLHLATEMTALWTASETFLQRNGVEAPFWAFAWAGGQALARHVLDRPEIVRGKRVLDFASGSGLVAIAAMKAGARRVIANDTDPFACEAMKLAFAANTVSVDIDTCDRIGEELSGIDLVLAGDVFYERSMADRVWPWFRDLAARGIDVLYGDPARTYAPADFIVRVDELRVPTSSDLEGTDEKQTYIYRVLR